MVSMTTGISLGDDCVNEFTALRMKRSHRYIIMMVNEDKTSIVVEKLGAREATFNDFKEDMPKDQGR